MSLSELLAAQTKEANDLGFLEPSEKLGEQTLRCVACGHRCLIAEGREGICKVRFNKGGKLFAPWGYTAGLQIDPIEKKPFYHAFPGSEALSFGMLGCDLHCGYCQNWISSQTLRDPEALALPRAVTGDELVAMARENGVKILTSTYNEPLITAEWAKSIFEKGKKEGMWTCFVSNGNATPEVIDYLEPVLDGFKVDLKSFQDKRYRELGGRLQPVLDSIKSLVDKEFWVELVTLVVPGFNDSEEELRDMARFIAGVSVDIPWHVTAYHEDYKMGGNGRTPASTLIRACETGKEEGLHFVYAGNLPGALGDWENTRCPGCEALLIKREGFMVLKNRLKDGKYPDCEKMIPGRFG